MFKIKSNSTNSIVFSGFFFFKCLQIKSNTLSTVLTCFKPLFYYIGFSNVFFFLIFSDTPSMYSTSVSARYYSQLMGKSTTSQSSESNTDNSKQSSESDAAVGATSSIEETFSLLQHAMTRAMRR
jgi:hypothetical protein